MSNLVKIKKLGIGAQFILPGYSPERKAGDPPSTDDHVWEIISRARKSGGNTPKETMFTIEARHVSKENPKKSDFPERHFNVEYEVIPVRPPQKTVMARDSRDQPEDVETIEEVAAREGVELPKDNE